MKNISIKLIIIFCLSILQFSVFGQDISTAAGGATGHGGIWGIGGQATNAELNIYGGLAVDKWGNIYIAQASEILKVDVASGLISIAAGTGVDGYNGDGIPATNAQLYGASDVTMDSSGNFYIGDGNNNRIRKVDIATGIITTFAGNGTSGFSGDGGPATAADCDFGPFAIDIFGNMILPTEADHRIRKVDVSGTITTIAGTGIAGNSGDGGPASAATMTPNALGICTDKYGNIYFSDSFKSVRKINVSTGIITRVAGTGSAIGSPYGGDGGPATSTIIDPVATAIDDTGNLYIADMVNSLILKVDTFGIIHTIAGNGTHGFSGDGGPATAAEINYPENVVLDICANVYIADFNNARVRKVTFDPTCTYQNQAALDINKLGKATSVSLYPNPAATTLTITSPNTITQVTISNLIGQTVYEQVYDIEKVDVDVGGLPPGVYVVKVTDGQGNVAVKKVVKD